MMTISEQAATKAAQGASFDPETVALLCHALDEAWDALPREQQALTSKGALAEIILPLAAQGERDPVRLCTYALTMAPILLKSISKNG